MVSGPETTPGLLPPLQVAAQPIPAVNSSSADTQLHDSDDDGDSYDDDGEFSPREFEVRSLSKDLIEDALEHAEPETLIKAYLRSEPRDELDKMLEAMTRLTPDDLLTGYECTPEGFKNMVRALSDIHGFPLRHVDIPIAWRNFHFLIQHKGVVVDIQNIRRKPREAAFAQLGTRAKLIWVEKSWSFKRATLRDDGVPPMRVNLAKLFQAVLDSPILPIDVPSDSEMNSE